MGEELVKTLKYCKRFRSIKSELDVSETKEHLMRKVEKPDEEGYMKRVRRCRDFEAVQLINLMPGTPAEATALIPTLADNSFLQELVSEIQPMREIDRDIK